MAQPEDQAAQRRKYFEGLPQANKDKIKELTFRCLDGAILFKTWLRGCREVIELSQDKLAEKCRLETHQAIQRAEVENRASKDIVARLADLFGVSDEEERDHLVQIARGTLPSVAPEDFDTESESEFPKLLDGLVTAISKVFTSSLKHAVEAVTKDSELAFDPGITEGVKRRVLRLKSGIHLYPERGILKRINKRHVLLRQETLVRLMKSLSASQLVECGREIGEGAAEDLLAHICSQNGGVFPETRSISDFIARWNYWDRTGGWGELGFETANVKNVSSENLPDKTEWRIRVRNSVLNTGNAEETERLRNFWCGYIHGFLEGAKPYFTDETTNVYLHVPSNYQVEGVSFLGQGSKSKYGEIVELYAVYFIGKQGA
jgi:hypothetical protein